MWSRRRRPRPRRRRRGRHGSTVSFLPLLQQGYAGKRKTGGLAFSFFPAAPCLRNGFAIAMLKLKRAVGMFYFLEILPHRRDDKILHSTCVLRRGRGRGRGRRRSSKGNNFIPATSSKFLFLKEAAAAAAAARGSSTFHHHDEGSIG
uniref:Uncharacterized protein n=1 Tax=Anopheles darlingi TaxID=43151 RepID=A0A2M4DBB5_ANODA